VLGLFWDWKIYPLQNVDAYLWNWPLASQRHITLLTKTTGRAAWGKTSRAVPMGRGWKRTGNVPRNRASPLPANPTAICGNIDFQKIHFARQQGEDYTVV
jgi:hypothetical protein